MFSRQRFVGFLLSIFMLLVFAYAVNSQTTISDVTTLISPATQASSSIQLRTSQKTSDNQTSDTIQILEGNEQALVVNRRCKPVELKVIDSDSNPAANRRIDLILIDKPSNAKDFKLPKTTYYTDSTGEVNIEPISLSVAGDYRAMVFLDDRPEVYTYISWKVNEQSWVMHLLFGLMGGLGMFLFGMNLGADGLQKIAGKRMKSILGTFTNNRYMGVLTGILVTAVTQSSSATTVMLVGFVNASLMTISQTLSVIFGANIGTTITVQLIAFDISHIALLMIGIGFLMTYSKNKTTVYVGNITMGFGFIFYGMKVMGISMSPLRSYPAFKELLISFSDYPISAIIGSMLFTALIQSSGATIGLIVVFAGQGLITLHASIPLILGAHTGTCITGWIASIGGSQAAKKTALLNIIYNLIGTLVFMPFLYNYLRFSDFVIWCTAPFSDSLAREVANAHMISAILKMLVMFPFYDQIIKLTHIIIAEKPQDENTRSLHTKYLLPTLLKSPELAMGNVAREILRMAGHVEYMMEKVPEMISYGREEMIKEVSIREDKVDTAQYEITKYLSQLFEGSITQEQTDLMMKYMAIINEFESQGDLIHKIIVPFARAKAREEIRFSEEGFRELLSMFDQTNENFKLVINSFAINNLEQAQRVAESERTFEVIVSRMRVSHMQRVFKHRVQSIETSTLHMDLLQCFKNLNLHSIEIAKSMINDANGPKLSNSIINIELANAVAEAAADKVILNGNKSEIDPLNSGKTDHKDANGKERGTE